MMIHIGTSGWSYDHWDGVLYPFGTPQRDRLAYYVQHFPTVEIRCVEIHNLQGMHLSVLSSDLRYHPHVHYLVPALALAPDAKRWLIGKQDFLVHVKPLGERVETKVRAALGMVQTHLTIRHIQGSILFQDSYY